MDDLDEITEIALQESEQLLLEGERLLQNSAATADDIAEIFQRVHTAKSNMMVLPESKLLSLLLQNLETAFSHIRSQNQFPPDDLKDILLSAFELATNLLEKMIAKKSVAALENEVYRCIKDLRLKASRIADGRS